MKRCVTTKYFLLHLYGRQSPMVVKGLETQSHHKHLHKKLLNIKLGIER